MSVIGAFLMALVAFYVARIIFSPDERPFDSEYHDEIQRQIAQRSRSEYEANKALKEKENDE